MISKYCNNALYVGLIVHMCGRYRPDSFKPLFQALIYEKASPSPNNNHIAPRCM